MLRELSVQNLALIEDARVDLRPGYCAWTGETGAGKSLLLTALGLVFGGKASADLVREGQPEARAAVVVDLSDDILKDDVETILGGSVEDDLVITRRVSSTGRSAGHANGLPVPASTLRALGDRLIDIHGQHETRALLDPNRQRDLLDAFGGVEPILAAYHESRSEHAALLDRRAALARDAVARDRERALLSFELGELAELRPRGDEPGELSREANRLAGAEAVQNASRAGFAQLYESDRSIQGILEKVARSLLPLAQNCPEVALPAEELSRLAEEAREVAYQLRRIAQGCPHDPRRLEEVESRLASYRRLAARHRCDVAELEAREASLRDRFDAIQKESSDLEAFDGPIQEAWKVVLARAADISTARRKAAGRFLHAIEDHFRSLGLAEARLAVEIVCDALPGDPFSGPAPAGGAERIELTFAANLGESARPLRKVASGGELSRVMLAIKTALAASDRVPTLVFDEIDAGVGGRLGAALGRKLAELARHHQIICVTHLPQIASFADHQWIIRKQTRRGRTRSTITPLDEDGRIDEIAAMLRGDAAAEGTRLEALAMLSEARVMA